MTRNYKNDKPCIYIEIGHDEISIRMVCLLVFEKVVRSGQLNGGSTMDAETLCQLLNL